METRSYKQRKRLEETALIDVKDESIISWQLPEYVL